MNTFALSGLDALGIANMFRNNHVQTQLHKIMYVNLMHICNVENSCLICGWSEEFTEFLDHANYLQPKNDETPPGQTIHSAACNVGKILDGLPSLRQSATVRVGKKHI